MKELELGTGWLQAYAFFSYQTRSIYQYEIYDRRVCEDPQDDEDEACQAPRKNRQGCCSVNDAADARMVAALLEIPFYVMNFKRDFGRIMDYFVDEYNAGRTPNPCVRCNDWLKFGRLHEYAKQIGADFVASGHYARIEGTEGRWEEATERWSDNGAT